jgi:hypothetical protein
MPSPIAIAAAISLALAVASLQLPSGPTYDPYAWLIWGRDIAHGGLSTTGTGTSWKPLPALIDALLAPLGGGAAGGWLVIARAGALFAVFMAFRLAWRLSPRGLRVFAGLVAAASLALTHDWLTRNGVGDAEGLMVAFGLLAIDRHLDARRGQALALLVAAALIRVEMWPFAAAYGAWLAWHATPRLRAAVLAGGLTIPLLWFGGDWVGSGSLTTAAGRALHPIPGSAGAAAHPASAVLIEAYEMLPLPAWLAIVAGLLLALIRLRGGTRARVTPVVALAGAAAVWTCIVAVMAQRGYPGLPRFVFMASALDAVAAGIGAALLVDALPRSAHAPGAIASMAAVLACVAFAVGAAPDARLLPADAAAIDRVADMDAGLAQTVRTAGGADAVTDCGSPATPWYAVTALAWDLDVPSGDVHDGQVGVRPVVFRQKQGDWRVSEASRCRLVAPEAS